jgi:hypothetical protein
VTLAPVRRRGVPSGPMPAAFGQDCRAGAMQRAGCPAPRGACHGGAGCPAGIDRRLGSDGAGPALLPPLPVASGPLRVALRLPRRGAPGRARCDSVAGAAARGSFGADASRLGQDCRAGAMQPAGCPAPRGAGRGGAGVLLGLTAGWGAMARGGAYAAAAGGFRAASRCLEAPLTRRARPRLV